MPNTDGINIFRSDAVSLLNWDVTCGDDCLAIKGVRTSLALSPFGVVNDSPEFYESRSEECHLSRRKWHCVWFLGTI